MPVAEFGAAMLRGMGWKEGEGIGRNKEEVKAVEYVKRPTRLGLGAKPKPVLQLKLRLGLQEGGVRVEMDEAGGRFSRYGGDVAVPPSLPPFR